jgi:hypothetical protein
MPLQENQWSPIDFSETCITSALPHVLASEFADVLASESACFLTAVQNLTCHAAYIPTD